jgi:hypothetical protein
MVGVARRLRPLKAPILFPLPPALASGCPHRGPMQSTLVGPCSCSPCRALAQMSTCGSATSMVGRRASESDLPHSLPGPPGSDRCQVCSTHCCILGLRAPDGFTWSWMPLLLNGACCFLQFLEGRKQGSLKPLAPALWFFFLGEALL